MSILQFQFGIVGDILLGFNSYLAKGLVEKLEVVNKKWVRVRLSPGVSQDSTVIRA